ncbi:MAG: elongation factor G [Rhodovibrionaceae bacterium]|nr:elongation factor G [Rhodovibrionaceae bacterium]
MTDKPASPPRCAVLVGSYMSGKTTLLEALLATAGAIHRQGTVKDGTTLGDATPEARARTMSVEPNFASAEYLGERWSFIDCPGSVELAQDARNALMAADVAVVVAEPEPDKALTLGPLLRFLDEYQIPHMIFVNKMDRAGPMRARDILSALQGVSQRPLVLRQVPIREGESVTGYVDLVSERAYRYQPGKPSDLIQLPDDAKDREDEARQELLESLADFDDTLLEQLLEDVQPPAEEIYAQIAKDLADDLIVPVLLGAAEQDAGVTRLWKALRHDAPGPEMTAARLGLPEGTGFAASVVKTLHLPHSGKLSIARIWRGPLKDGTQIGGHRLSGIYRLKGQEQEKLAQAETGDVVGMGRMDDLQTGDLVTEKGGAKDSGMLWPDPLSPVYARALAPENRQDEVKLSASMQRLQEEDPSLVVEHDQETGQLLLWGQGDIHLQIAAERLKTRYNVEVNVLPPQTAYLETIRRGTKKHARFKRQTGGHGQFADIHVEVSPLPRGAGFEFHNKIVGGAVPKQYIPAVEAGVKEGMERGPLGFPVVDLEVTLFDGQHHSVDSSDQAFKTAGRIAIQESLPECEPVLLEPIFEVSIAVPNDFTNKIHGLVSTRRGQILGFAGKEGWEGWDELKAYMPQSEIHDLILELRSLTLGIGMFESRFDHLQELTGKLAERVIAAQQQAAQ